MSGGPTRAARADPGAIVEGKTAGKETPTLEAGAKSVVLVTPAPLNGK